MPKNEGDIMQQATSEYAAAIVAGYRRILPRAIIDIVDPDTTYGAVTASGQSRYSRPEQLYDKVFDMPVKYATLEPDRFRLDGSFRLYPDSAQEIPTEHAFMGDVQCGDDGVFTTPPYVQLNVSNLSVMQACSVHFSEQSCDGIGVDFTVEVYSGSVVAHSKTIAGNRNKSVYFEGFTAYNVTAIRVTFKRWSVPNRYVRLLEIVPGIYEHWEGDTLYSVDVLQETALHCMAIPYGTCTLSVHNKNKRFNPYNRAGLFRSIEERQGIAVALGVETDSGAEYLPLGVYYQQSDGWETDAYGLTITFKLVDIIGLLASRAFNVPSALPVTLDGWIAAIVAHLGDNFKERYLVDGAISVFPLTADAESLKSVTCGTLLRYLCMACGASFCADNATGKLKVFRLPTGGGVSIDADNMSSYPKNQPTDSIAQIAFRLADASKTEYVVNGSLVAADKSLSISNPFIHTTAQADAAAQYILSFYGGTQFTTSGRGDMRSELGDIDTVYTGFENMATGRRFKQQFKITNGVMKNVPSYLLEVGTDV